MALYYLFNFTIREVGNINASLRHLLLEVISKKHNKKEVLFNYFDKSEI